ncbi:MAG: ABC transporter substrate-binding protein [bacterium]|nr:ABC transporter substrate-binding protein [bacterium]
MIRQAFPLMCALTIGVLTVALAGTTPSLGAPALSETQQKWLLEAQLGPHSPATHDWAAIEAAARKEGKVVVYSSSSRTPAAAKSFEAAYPGIKVEAFDMGTVEVISKVKEEVRARVRTGDVFFAGDPPTVIYEMVPRRMLWNFVPSELVGLIPKELREPLLVQRLGTRVIIYNSEVYKTPPITSWWDLTKPQWKGKVQIKDIFESGENLSLMATFVKHADHFASSYKEAFGKEIVLDKDCPNAAFQWIKNFLKNDPVFAGSDGDATSAVGRRGQKDPPLATVDYAKYRDVMTGRFVFEVALDVKPVGAVFYQTYLGVIDQAPHPNAAKLMIRWLMGDSRGGKGYEPWFVPGDYPVRTGMLEFPRGAVPMAVLKTKAWTIDPMYAYEHGARILDFWVANQRRR